MTRALDPYTAVVISSFGGPNGPDDVLPFMRNATAGRGISDERLMQVSEHYLLFGGKSPINELNEQLRTAIAKELQSRGCEVPIVIANRNWHPYYSETIPQLIEDGHHQVIALSTSAYQSYSGCRQYAEDFERALEDSSGTLHVDRVSAFGQTDGFVDANTDALIDALQVMATREFDGELRVVFVTHSIPDSMNEHSRTGDPKTTYVEQHLNVARRIAKQVEEKSGQVVNWELAFCSRSGSPHTPWLEPDVNDKLRQLKTDKIGAVIVAPIGFIMDHMEVLYDLDTEACDTAKQIDLEFVRAATVGTHPAFISMLADEIFAMKENQAKPPEQQCHFDDQSDCCIMKTRTEEKL